MLPERTQEPLRDVLRSLENFHFYLILCRKREGSHYDSLQDTRWAEIALPGPKHVSVTCVTKGVACPEGKVCSARPSHLAACFECI